MRKIGLATLPLLLVLVAGPGRVQPTSAAERTLILMPGTAPPHSGQKGREAGSTALPTTSEPSAMARLSASTPRVGTPRHPRPPQPSQSERFGEQHAVRLAVRAFLTAFENLDRDRFDAFFADDATAFFPSPEPAKRYDGKAAVEARFRHVFAEIRKRSGAQRPPFHQLDPIGLLIQPIDARAAIATFTLVNDQRTARRTLVFRRDPGGWHIVHLHASNVLL